MARKKTSAEKAREDAENEKVENMLDGAFGTLSGLETNKPDESISKEDPNQDENTQEIQEETEEIISKDLGVKKSKKINLKRASSMESINKWVTRLERNFKELKDTTHYSIIDESFRL